MTFEEFFHKKKIDLLQLQKAEASLFAEFKSHYEVMGEKSFDHSKKFWFNKLRRLYHIIEEAKPAKVSIEVNQIASHAEPLNAPVAEVKQGFTPRFKARTVPNPDTQLSEENKIAEEPKLEAETPKPAFKPRFKPQMAKPLVPPVDSDQSMEVEKQDGAKPEPAKPAYIPRFKAPVTTRQTSIPEEKPDAEELSKPAYKPRFKPQMVKPSEPVIENEKIAEIKAEEPEIEANLPRLNIKEEEENTSTEPPKATFKPKFTPRNFKPKSQQ